MAEPSPPSDHTNDVTTGLNVESVIGKQHSTHVRLYAYGVAILLAIVVLVLTGAERGSAGYLSLLGVASVAYLAAVYEVVRAHGRTGGLVICLALAALWRVSLLLTPPAEHDDVYRYIWDGRLQRLGYNPYLKIPADPNLAHLHTPATRRMNNPHISSPYPPAAQLFFRVVSGIHESVVAFRLALVLCDVLIVIVILSWLARMRLSPWLVLAYAWNPLVALEGAGNGHIDLLGVLLLAISFLALTRGRTAVAAVSFALAVSVKFLPIVLVPLFWGRVRMRDVILGCAVFVALYVPFLIDGRVAIPKGWIPTGSLSVLVDKFRFNDLLFALLESIANPRAVAGLAVLVGLGVAGWLRVRLPPHSPAAWAWPMAGALFFAPLIYPWYLVWLTPFLTTLTTLPLMVWTVSVLSTYVVWHLADLGAAWVVPWWVSLFEYGTVGAAAGWVIFYRRTRKVESIASPGDPPDGS
ncbi:MAG: glycosyltransferase family 87 protein [Bacteroidota bacterium]